MPVIRYIGRESLQKGKSLYEISRRLANGGLGRVVYRQRYADVWPTEKSFIRLTRVVPDKTSTDCRKGSAWGNEVFRGIPFGEQMIDTGHKSDWWLVPKHLEEEFCKITDVWRGPEEPPADIPSPPWMNLLMRSQNKKAAAEDSNNEPLRIALDRHEIMQTQIKKLKSV